MGFSGYGYSLPVFIYYTSGQSSCERNKGRKLEGHYRVIAGRCVYHRAVLWLNECGDASTTLFEGIPERRTQEANQGHDGKKKIDAEPR